MRRHTRFLLTTAALFLFTLGCVPAGAEHFDIFMSLRSASGVADSGWDTDPPEGGLHERQVVSARAGEDLVLEWRLRSEFPHGTMKEVGIRIFVAPEGAIGQKQLPAPSAPRVIDNSFTADFLPQHSARGEVHFRVTEPGAYLVRLQSENTLNDQGHEHFAAVDLKVE